VTASYPGATAETLAETVATPLEEGDKRRREHALHVVVLDWRRYADVTVTFAQGADINEAQVLVPEPRVDGGASPAGRGPPDWGDHRQNSPDLLLVATLTSPDGSLPQQYLSTTQRSRSSTGRPHSWRRRRAPVRWP